MARGIYSTSNYFLYSGGLITTMPLTIAAWVYAAQASLSGVDQSIIGLNYTAGASTVIDGWVLAVEATTGNTKAIAGNGIGTASAKTSTGISPLTWGHIAGVYVSGTSRYAYLNGVIGTQNTSNITPSANPDKTLIGLSLLQNNTVFSAATRKLIADVGIWNVALTAAEILQLAAGYSPLFVRPESLVAYYPLIRGDSSGDEPDLMGGLKMVEQGTVSVQPHGRVFYPISPLPISVEVTDVTLTVADATHALSSDAIALTQEHTLVVEDATHALTSDAIILTQAHTLVVADATHALTSDAISLTQVHTLVVADATHVLSSDTITFSLAYILVLSLDSALIRTVSLGSALIQTVELETLP